MKRIYTDYLNDILESVIIQRFPDLELNVEKMLQELQKNNR